MLCQDVSLFNYSKNQNHFINYYHEFYASYSDDHVSSMWWGWCKLQTEPAQLKVELLCWGYRLSLATPGTPGTPASGSGSAASCDKPVQTEPRLLSGAGITRHISGSASNPWIYEVMSVRVSGISAPLLHSLFLNTLKLRSNTQQIQHIRLKLILITAQKGDPWAVTWPWQWNFLTKTSIQKYQTISLDNQKLRTHSQQFTELNYGFRFQPNFVPRVSSMMTQSVFPSI